MTIATRDGIGLIGLDHVGLTVPDLEEATRFFVEVLGFDRAYRLGPFKSDDNWLNDNIDADARAVLHIQVVTCGNGKIELFGFDSPRQRKVHPQRDDVGAASIGLLVADVDEAASRLKNHGVQLLGGRKDVADGPIAGTSWIYAKTSWGLLVFIMQRVKA
jgi:catechol 2,3-dioxygenase-like lactoylglutathione lyase family enzyme